MNDIEIFRGETRRYDLEVRDQDGLVVLDGATFAMEAGAYGSAPLMALPDAAFGIDAGTGKAHFTIPSTATQALPSAARPAWMEYLIIMTKDTVPNVIVHARLTIRPRVAA